MCRFQSGPSVHPDNCPQHESPPALRCRRIVRLPRCPLAFALWHNLCLPPYEGEELLCHPGGVGRAPVCPQFRQYACVRYALVFQSRGVEVLDMGGVDGGVNVVSDKKTGKEIDEDDEVPADMVDDEFCPVASPHEILLPNAIAGFL